MAGLWYFSDLYLKTKNYDGFFISSIAAQSLLPTIISLGNEGLFFLTFLANGAGRHPRRGLMAWLNPNGLLLAFLACKYKEKKIDGSELIRFTLSAPTDLQESFASQSFL